MYSNIEFYINKHINNKLITGATAIDGLDHRRENILLIFLLIYV